MHPDQMINFLKSTKFFSELSNELLEQIARVSTFKQLKKDEILIYAQSHTHSIYIITQGNFSVYLSGDITNNRSVDIELARLKQHDLIGELAFLDNLPRSANVKALEEHCGVIEIDGEQLSRLLPTEFYKQLAKKLTTDIRISNEIMVNNLKAKLAHKTKLVNMGKFITYSFLLMAIYNLTLKVFTSLVTYPYTRMFAGTLLIGVFTLILTIMIRHMGYSFQQCGVNLNNWRSSLKESLAATGLFLFVVTFFKWILMETKIIPTDHFLNFDVIVPVTYQNAMQFYTWFFTGMIVYGVFSILQEFIARGVFQGTLEDFFEFKYKNLLANVVASAVFASIHIHLSPIFALSVIFPSLLWGWLYSRHKTLIGPAVSHILIGWWAIFGLGIKDLLSANGGC